MSKKYLMVFFVILLVAVPVYAGEDVEEIVREETQVSEGAASTDDFAFLADAIFDRAHMCSQSDTNEGCRIPKSHILLPEQPRFHVRFWAPAGQNYTRYYLLSDSGGTLVHIGQFSDFLSSGWHELWYTPGPSFSSGDYIFTVVYQGTDGRAAVKSAPYGIR
jgi:hypothetical protein